MGKCQRGLGWIHVLFGQIWPTDRKVRVISDKNWGRKISGSNIYASGDYHGALNWPVSMSKPRWFAHRRIWSPVQGLHTRLMHRIHRSLNCEKRPSEGQQPVRNRQYLKLEYFRQRIVKGGFDSSGTVNGIGGYVLRRWVATVREPNSFSKFYRILKKNSGSVVCLSRISSEGEKKAYVVSINRCIQQRWQLEEE